MSLDDLDVRLRRAMIRNAPSLDDLDAENALSEVLHRSARRRGLRRGAYVVGAAVAAVGAGVLSMTLSHEQAAPPPAGPTVPSGTYERTATSGRWQGDWSVTLETGRVLRIFAPDGVSAEEAPTDGASYRISGSRLMVDAFANGLCTELPPGSYGWSEVGGGLLLQAIDDPCTPRREVFAGLWEPSS